MANKHLRLGPHEFKDEPRIWWYEERGGVRIIVDIVRGLGAYHETIYATIPWKVLRAALARKDRPNEPTDD